jgi:uncharacterized iron-regulated membrane protein
MVVGAAVVLGLVVGVTGASIALAGSSKGAASDTNVMQQAPGGPAATPTTDWPKNAQGQTYGSAAEATSPQDEPDLILAEATNGRVGYVLRTDLEGPTPTTPQEALSEQAAQAGKDQAIPVYLSDGTTKIGVFIVSHSGQATEMQASSPSPSPSS